MTGGERIRLLWALFALVGVLVLAALTIYTGRSATIPMGSAAPPPPWSNEPITPLLTTPQLDPRRVSLGQDLFHDPRLSGRGDLPCSACHDMTSNGVHAGPRRTRLDTPTIFNAALSSRLGWQGRDRTLEGQAQATLAVPLIAHGVPFSVVEARLRADPVLAARFREIYGRAPDEAAVLDALATYQRTQVTPGSRFDRWLAGDPRALSQREIDGYELFKRIGCVSCHQGRNVGGNMVQRHGIFRPLASPLPRILRVPSLRNVAATAPYFHDGSAPTLEIAVQRMAASQLDVDLTEEEIQGIAAFLRSLTGRRPDGQWVSAPR